MRGATRAMLAVGLALLAPGSAIAQSVGDDQYRDPFGEDGQQQDQGSGETQDGADTGSGTPAPSPAPAPAPAPAPSASEPTATTAATLPRTGLAAGLVAGLGLVLLAAGAGLRRGLGGRDGT